MTLFDKEMKELLSTTHAKVYRKGWRNADGTTKYCSPEYIWRTVDNKLLTDDNEVFVMDCKDLYSDDWGEYHA